MCQLGEPTVEGEGLGGRQLSGFIEDDPLYGLVPVVFGSTDDTTGELVPSSNKELNGGRINLKKLEGCKV